MDQELRNRLRNVVNRCRKLLEDDTREALEGRFNIFAKKDVVTADPDAPMAHLSDEEQAARKDILDHFVHIKARGFKPKDALDQLVREIAFTHLNRLCAYKMMEAREVYVGGHKFREAVSRGINSNGVKFYLADHPEDERLFNTGHQDIAYRHFLDWLGGLLSEEIGVLFNPNDSANRVYPRQKTLDVVLDLLNGGGIKPDEQELRRQWPTIWSQDETIGWVYQYFTPKELRDQARKASLIPRNSYELAFRNQFFTPRYVVEFLTDNTLGRIWYESRKGDTRLKDQCRYMVRRPTEVFLGEGEEPPASTNEVHAAVAQEQLRQIPVYVPHRPKKDPRELKILDPACGSGHFLLYCFDVLLTIYEEGYTDPDLGPALKRDYPTLEALKRELPRLILARNLHGIDIDLRATQIAALALWLRCQRAFQEMGLKKERPTITRSNFVCAEPMPGEEFLLEDFVGQLEPKVVGQVVKVVFEKMRLAGETGSLLKIEEEIRATVAAAKNQYVRETTHAQDRKGHLLLFSEGAMDRLAGKPTQEALFDLSGVTDDEFFSHAEARVLAALQRYSEQAHTAERLQRRLFAEDTSRGFAFVDICRHAFDTILMNPPFGSATQKTQEWFRTQYPAAAENVTVGFIIQSMKRLAAGGLVGLIGDLPWLQQSTYVKFRSSVLENRSLELFVELGWGILGTDVEVCVAVFNSRPQHRTLFASLVGDQQQEASLRSTFSDSNRFAFRSLSDFLPIENHPFAYQISEVSLGVFREQKRLSESLFIAAGGVKTSDADRVFRCWWEVPTGSIGRNSAWAFCQNGSPYSPFYYPTYFVIRSDEGSFSTVMSYPTSRTPNSERYWISGLAYGKRTWEMYCYPMPSEQVITQEGNGLYPVAGSNVWHCLAIGNSTLYSYLANLVAGQHKYAGYLNTICMAADRVPLLGDEAEHIYKSIRGIDELNELSHSFNPYSLATAISSGITWVENVGRLESEIQKSISRIDDVVLRATGEQIHLTRRPPSGGSYFAAITDQTPSFRTLCEFAVSLLVGVAFGRWPNISARASEMVTSHDPFAPLGSVPPAMGLGDSTSDGRPVSCDVDGILVDDPDHPNDIVRKAREACDLIWGTRTEEVEGVLCANLGVSTLREYFRRAGAGGFWLDHANRYSKSRRKAPVFWLLQSSRRNYALWLYYTRLDKDLLFKALVNYVEPKLRLEEARLESFRADKAAVTGAKKEADRIGEQIERQEDLLSEMRDFEDKLRRAANLHLEPDLDDGVMLNLAPLHELVPWDEATNCWDELLEGEYKWSSIGKQLRQKGMVK